LNYRARWFVDCKKSIVLLIVVLFTKNIFPQRVVSLAPALTEIVFALGKGDRLVGVTKFCDYPLAAQKIKKVGGFLDINIEVLLALSPEIVVLYPEQYQQVKLLEKQAFILVVKHNRLIDLFRSIQNIGWVLHAENEADGLVLSIKNELNNISQCVKGRNRSRTLIIAGRNVDELKNMYIVGKNDFLNDLLEIAGGVNVYNGSVNYPNISLESVIFLNPDFIFEISAFYEGIADEKIFALWSPYNMISAVRNKQIKIVKESFWLRPGPRVGFVAAELANFFSPKTDKEKSHILK
jgi:iron complex transport system substrate-binding protein